MGDGCIHAGTLAKFRATNSETLANLTTQIVHAKAKANYIQVTNRPTPDRHCMLWRKLLLNSNPSTDSLHAAAQNLAGAPIFSRTLLEAGPASRCLRDVA